MKPEEIERRLGSMIQRVEHGRTKNLVPFGNVMTSIAWCVGYLTQNRNCGFPTATHHWVFGIANAEGAVECDKTVPATCVLAVGWTEGDEDEKGHFKDPCSVRHWITLGVGQSQPDRGIVTVWPEAFGNNVPMNAWEEWAKIEAPDRFKVDRDSVGEWFGPELLSVVEANLPVYYDRCVRRDHIMDDIRAAWEKAKLKARHHDECWARVEAAIVRWGDQGHGFNGVTSHTGLAIDGKGSAPVLSPPEEGGSIKAVPRREGLYPS